MEKLEKIIKCQLFDKPGTICRYSINNDMYINCPYISISNKCGYSTPKISFSKKRKYIPLKDKDIQNIYK